MPPTSSPVPPVAPSASFPVTTKVVAVAALLVVFGGLYYWYTSISVPSVAPAAPATNNRPASIPESAPVVTAAANTNTSDAALVKDAAAIDTQLTGLSSDTSSLGATDQPIQQSY